MEFVCLLVKVVGSLVNLVGNNLMYSGVVMTPPCFITNQSPNCQLVKCRSS